MNCIKSSSNKICKSATTINKNSTKNYLLLKSKLRNLWSSYFNIRYLNVFGRENNGEVYKYSFNDWKHPSSPLFFQETKFNDLFEFASKAKLLSASLLTVDVVEVSASIDCYKEGYPFTVRLFLYY